MTRRLTIADVLAAVAIAVLFWWLTRDGKG